MKGHLAGPEWLECISEQLNQYEDDISSMDDDFLKEESYRVEVECPPSEDHYNDRDWRLFRRLIRQEMHRRGFKTPKHKPAPF